MNDRSCRGAKGATGATHLVCVGMALLWVMSSGVAWPKDLADDLRQTMSFAASMAERGNWREARFRWEGAHKNHPEDPRLLNNLAVALEALGEPEKALEYYERAVAASGGHSGIRGNLQRSSYFWTNARSRGESADDAAEPDAETESETDPDEPLQLARAAADGANGANRARAGKKGKSKGKTFRVSVGLPVPPRLKLEGHERILVVSFLSEETNLMDTNRELVRFLRAEFRKNTEHVIPEINPPPAIPEQTVDDLLANSEFWKHLGRNYESDLIVSGVVHYDRADISGFEDVDLVSARTGQKVRRAQFVEQEEFQYSLDIFFMDGATGKLRFRDRLRRSVVFQGLQNDPIAAFYALSESIATDVLAVVTERIRVDTRLIFKK